MDRFRYLTDNPILEAAHESSCWRLAQQHSLGNGERYSVNQTVQLAPSVKGRYLVVKTDGRTTIRELDESNNYRATQSQVTPHAADLRVSEILTQPENFSGEETTVSWTVTNVGDALWPGTQSWTDIVYLSSDPVFIRERATVLGGVTHANVQGLPALGSYTAATKVRLPAGTDGGYFIYVITDNAQNPQDYWNRKAQNEMLGGGSNGLALGVYAARI